MLDSLSNDRALQWQALRLVKESIIQVQSPETEVDDIDFVDDLGEVEDVVARFRRAEQEGAAGNAATAAEQQPPLNGELYHTCADVASSLLAASASGCFWELTGPVKGS